MSASNNVTVTGMAETTAALRRVGEQIAAAAKAAEDEAAQVVADDMRSRVAVDTGELRDDIDVQDGATGKEVGAMSVEHAGFVEFGTSTQVAQPYAMPAAEAERQRLPGRVTTAVKGAVG